MAEYGALDHDVLVIGAGGAGLQTAIEASATGTWVGLVCESLPLMAVCNRRIL